MLLRPIVACLAVAALAAEDLPITPEASSVTTASAAAPDLRLQASYLIGLNMAGAVKQFDLDIDEVTKAMRDELAGKAQAFTPEQKGAILKAYQAEMKSHSGAKNKALLAEKAKKPGVKVTASGLIYEVLKASDKPDAKTPGPTDTVLVHYTGTFPNGEIFDSSEKRGEPISFPVNGVIPGWTEALQLMKEGDRFHLVLPSAIAYGEQGSGKIPPDSVLEFDVELLQVTPANVPAAPPTPKP